MGAVCEQCNKDMMETDGCTGTHLVFDDGEEVERLKYGEEERYGDLPDFLQAQEDSRCGDCNVKYGHYHHPGCDIEECPRCGLQFISCDCKLLGED